MRNLFVFNILILVAIVLNSCNSDSGTASPDNTEVKFEITKFDFGKLEHKADASIEFMFTNIGDKPLIITNVSSSCGCTVPSYPKDALKPGEKASIKVKYDSNRVGVFHKSVKVFCNTDDSPVKLEISGEVKGPELPKNDSLPTL